MLAQLLLLDVDWSLEPGDLVDSLSIVGPSGITRDGRGVSHRDGRSGRGTMNVEAIRADYRGSVGGKSLSRPYARGRKRRVSTAAVVRRKVLKTVLRAHPRATVSELWHGWNGTGAGWALHHRLDAALTTAGLGLSTRPSKDTLYRDLKALRSSKR